MSRPRSVIRSGQYVGVGAATASRGRGEYEGRYGQEDCAGVRCVIIPKAPSDSTVGALRVEPPPIGGRTARPRASDPEGRGADAARLARRPSRGLWPRESDRPTNSPASCGMPRGRYGIRRHSARDGAPWPCANTSPQQSPVRRAVTSARPRRCRSGVMRVEGWSGGDADVPARHGRPLHVPRDLGSTIVDVYGSR